MTKSSIFKYYDKISQIPNTNGDTFVGILPEFISDKSSLFKALDNILLLPGWWGSNWDALYDCLRDFEWIKEKRIVLVHKELPKFSDNDLRVYLNILFDSVAAWKDGDNHELIVWFPENCKVRISTVAPYGCP